ncbi:MAG: DNA polymerase IV [Candidatus Paceibacterota bacterium]
MAGKIYWKLKIENWSLSNAMPLALEPLNLSDFPRAILHIDGDCFFASCEIALNPKLRGLPVVTGKERGIASSMSYEAKAMGVKRAMSLAVIKKICPNVIILPSDYETYSLFSVRMFDIVRRYTPQVEEYSIDECFADLTGLQRPLNMPYEKMAELIKHDLDTELGMTFSLGLAPTKVLAKVGSKWKKPSGLTIIPGNDAHIFLAKLPLEKIWGIGEATSEYLFKFGLKTALDFAKKDIAWIKGHLTKPHFEIWQELRGISVYPVSTQAKDDYKSISKTKTFTPPSSDKKFIFSQLSKNIENACIKARRYDLAAKKFYFFLKTQDFKYCGSEIETNTPVNSPTEILGLARQNFEKVYRPGTLYRATGITLVNLETKTDRQMDLFGKSAKAEKFSKIFESVDKLEEKFGKHTVFLGSSFQAISCSKPSRGRNCLTTRNTDNFKGETKRQRIGIPLLRQVN